MKHIGQIVPKIITYKKNVIFEKIFAGPLRYRNYREMGILHLHFDQLEAPHSLSKIIDHGYPALKGQCHRF